MVVARQRIKGGIARERSVDGKQVKLEPLIANIHAALPHVKATAGRFKTADRWAVLLRYVSDKIASTLAPFKPPPWLPATE